MPSANPVLRLLKRILSILVVTCFVLVTLIQLIFMSPLLLLIAFHHYYLQEWKLIRILRRAGRFLLPPAADPATLRGTLIIDDAAPNHTRIRLWWTPDVVLPPLQPSDDDDFEAAWSPAEQHFYARYLDPQTGSARYLSCSLSSAPLPETLKQKFPHCTLATFRTATRHLRASIIKTTQSAAPN